MMGRRILLLFILINVLGSNNLCAQQINYTYRQLNFGTVAYISSPGTITINSTSDTPQVSGVFAKPSSGAQRGMISFRATGSQYTINSITVGNTSLTYLSNSITFTGYTISNMGMVIAKNATDYIYFGGTLTITNSLPVGLYSGSVPITLNYN